MPPHYTDSLCTAQHTCCPCRRRDQPCTGSTPAQHTACLPLHCVLTTSLTDQTLPCPAPADGVASEAQYTGPVFHMHVAYPTLTSTLAAPADGVASETEYTGPVFQELDERLQDEFRSYLLARWVAGAVEVAVCAVCLCSWCGV